MARAAWQCFSQINLGKSGNFKTFVNSACSEDFGNSVAQCPDPVEGPDEDCAKAKAKEDARMYFEDLFDPDEQPPSSNDYSESGDSCEDSDEDDAFELCALPADQLPPDYQKCFTFRWARAITEVASQLRDDVSLPLGSR